MILRFQAYNHGNSKEIGTDGNIWHGGLDKELSAVLHYEYVAEGREVGGRATFTNDRNNASEHSIQYRTTIRWSTQ